MNHVPQISDQIFSWFQKALEWETNGKSKKIMESIKTRYRQQSKHHQKFDTKINKYGVRNS